MTRRYNLKKRAVDTETSEQFNGFWLSFQQVEVNIFNNGG